MIFPDKIVQTSPIKGSNKISNAQWNIDYEDNYVYDPEKDGEYLEYIKERYNPPEEDILKHLKSHYNACVRDVELYQVFLDIQNKEFVSHYFITVKESFEGKQCEERIIGMYCTQEQKLIIYKLPIQGFTTIYGEKRNCDIWHTRTNFEVTIRNPDGTLADLGENSYVYFRFFM